RLVDDTHPATAKFLHDAVVGDCLADHFEGRILWWTKGQVNEDKQVGHRRASVSWHYFPIELIDIGKGEEKAHACDIALQQFTSRLPSSRVAAIDSLPPRLHLTLQALASILGSIFYSRLPER